jgi:uncharacterized membrane protein
MSETQLLPPEQPGSDPNKTVAIAVYALQAAFFVAGITVLVAIVINYVKRSEVRGTWLESHFRWQIRTFWWGLLWFVVASITVYILVGFLIFFVLAIWYIYRIARGWLRLAEGKAMYAD